MENVDRRNDQCHIVASSSLIDDHIKVLKQGDTFGLFDQYGNIHSLRTGSQGLYHEGTRFLSRFELTINGEQPLLLSSTVKEDNVLLNVDLTNPDMTHEGQVEIARGVLHLSRARFLWQGLCFERLRVHNYSHLSIPVRLSISVEADFADLFEVRGKIRSRRGRCLEAVTSKDGISLGYEGLDRVDRRVTVYSAPAPTAVHPGGIRFDTLLPAGEVVQWDTPIPPPEAYELLGSNPLPDAFRVTPSSPGQIDKLRDALAPVTPSGERTVVDPAIDEVKNRRDETTKILSATRVVKLSMGLLTALLVLACARGGTLALAGIYMSPIPPLEYEQHLFQERRITSMFELGSVARVDVLKAKVRVSDADVALIRQQNQVDIERARLATMLGLEPHTPLQLAGELQPGPAPLDSTQAVLESDRRPDLQSAREQLRSAKNMHRAATLSRIPGLFATFSYSNSGGTTESERVNSQTIIQPGVPAAGDTTFTDVLYTFPVESDLDFDQWAFRVGASVTLDAFLNTGQSKRTAAIKNQAEYDLEGLELDVRREVQEAILNAVGLNPVIVHPSGEGVSVVDALIVKRQDRSTN